MKFSLFMSFPPSRRIAAFASSSSSSIPPAFIARKYPPFFTKGRSYSESTESLATARETEKSKAPLHFLS